MRVLVLGNTDSKWVKEYIENVLLPLGHDVEVLGNEATCKYLDFYRSNHIVIHHEEKAGRLLRKIPFARVMNSASRTVKKNTWNHYDLIINMFVNHRDLRITNAVKNAGTKTVLYYTGSDLLRKSRFNILLNRVLLSRPDAFAVGSGMLAKGFKKKYPAGTPVSIIHFGISAFENIREYKASHPNEKKKSVFCIGYSGVQAHNHLAVLDLFDRLTPEQKEKIELVVPMTYMATKDYLAQVRAKLESVGVRYRQLTDFMSNDEMAEMWCGVSYFINAQSTDSLSASVLEALYAGAILLNASWLSYPEYRELGIRSLSFDNYEELYGLITDLLNGKADCSSLVVSERLEEKLSWAAARDAWRELFSRFDQT